MIFSDLIRACAVAAIMLPAHAFAEENMVFKSFEDLNGSILRLRASAPALSSETHMPLTGDFDLCYYWYDFGTGTVSETWETSKYEYITENPDGTYTLSNFMADALKADQSDSDFKVADINAEYDAVTDAYVIAGNQYLYTFDNDGSDIDICVIGVRLNEDGKLQPDKNIDIVLRREGMGYVIDPAMGAVAVLIGAEVSPGSYGGFGLCQNCALYAWNGTMIYFVATDRDTEAMPYTCNVWAEVTGSCLYLANYADCGYHRKVAFDVDFNGKTMEATNASLQTLVDSNGNPTELYAADMLDGGGAWTKDGNYKLSASYFCYNGATMIMQGNWGAYFMEQPVGFYYNTQTLLNFVSGLNSGTSLTELSEKAPVYYNLQGIMTDNPSGGLFISRGRKVLIP